MTERPPVSLLGAAEIRRLADELDLRPTKTLGQNFVHDGNTVRRIVAAADLRSTDHVLEVGPGLGSLTLGLLDAVAAVTAVEIDPRLAGLLTGPLPQHAPRRLAALQVITADALHITADRLRLHDPEVAAPADPTALVANLPYNVAVPVLLHLLAEVPTLRQRAGDGAGRGRRPAGGRAGFEDLRVAEREDRLVRHRPSGRFDRPVGVLAGARRRLRAGGVRAPRTSRGPTTGRPSSPSSTPLSPSAARRCAPRLPGWAGSAAYAETVLRRARVDPTARGEVLDVDDFARIAAALEAIDAAERE